MFIYTNKTPFFKGTNQRQIYDFFFKYAKNYKKRNQNIIINLLDAAQGLRT